MQEPGSSTATKKTVLIKRDTVTGTWKSAELPAERKRPYLRYTKSNNDKPSTDANTSVFDRLYDQRSKPSQSLVNSVKKQCQNRTKFLTTKYLSPAKSSVSNEPACKKLCHRRSTSSTQSDSSVYERLYAERKQVNFKRLTDSEKRDVYLARQREDIQRFQRACAERKKNKNMTNDYDDLRSSSSTETTESGNSYGDSGLDCFEYISPDGKAVVIQKPDGMSDEKMNELVFMVQYLQTKVKETYMKRHGAL